jgi:hypothetical protein
MTSAKSTSEQLIRRAGALPLARIASAMLAAATGFFCYAMPQRMLDALLGVVGLPVPIGALGRTVFVLVFAALAAILGWLIVTVAGSGARIAQVETETDFEELTPRRRAVGPTPAIEAMSAAAPIAVRRGDSHPDAPPRRPIFADQELPGLGDPDPIVAAPDAEQPETAVFAEVPGDAELSADIVAPEDADEFVLARVVPEPAPAEPAYDPEDQAVSGSDLPPADEPAPEPDALTEPLELVEPLPPVSPPATAKPAEALTLSELMARFERGLDERGGNLPPAPDADRVAALQEPQPAADDTLRTALEALQRMAARQR